MKRLATFIFLVMLIAPTVFAQDQFFVANGVRLHYTVAGVGETVVLIHGWASDGRRNWSAVISDLSKNHQVVTIDCRGHGQSDKPVDEKSYGVEMVDDIVRLLDHLKIGKAHVAGYSMGAMIAMKLVATHPERVASVIFAGQGGVREDTDAKADEPVLKLLDSGMSVADALIATAGEPKPNEAEQRLIRFAFGNADAKALAACMRGFRALLVKNKELAKFKTPSLAIYSVEGATVEPIGKLIRGIELKKIADANHMSAPFKPEFVAAIRDFIDRHATAGGRKK